MKNTPLILSIIALVAVAALGIISLTADGSKKTAKDQTVVEATAQPGAIVWFDLDRILNEYDMANDLRSVVESKVQSIQDEVNRRMTQLQNDANKFQSDLDKGLLVRSVAEQRGLKLQERQESFNAYAAEKQQEIAEEQQVMLNQIGDAIKNHLDKFNAEKKYAMIISTQGSILPAPVSTADPELDITDELLQGLNDEYVKSKSKAGSESVTRGSDQTKE